MWRKYKICGAKCCLKLFCTQIELLLVQNIYINLTDLYKNILQYKK